MSQLYLWRCFNDVIFDAPLYDYTQLLNYHTYSNQQESLMNFTDLIKNIWFLLNNDFAELKNLINKIWIIYCRIVF